MSLNLDRSTWKRVKLGDVVLRSRTQVDPFEGKVDRYVAGGHIDTDSVIISRSGDVADGQMGSTFRYVFKPGQALFVSARPYLRKSGVPGFAGVVADKTYVLNAVPDNGLIQAILPFLLTSGRFVEYATQEATGSMNPRLLWGAMQRYEFDLPSLDEQKRIADLLWAIEAQRAASDVLRGAIADARRVLIDSQLNVLMGKRTVQFGQTWARSPEGGWSAAPIADFTGRFVLSLAALGPDGYRLGHYKNVPDTPEVRATVLSLGDLLISRANTADMVGRAGIFCEDRADVSFPDTIMRLRLQPTVLPEFAEAVLSSSFGRRHMRRTAAGSATSMVKINRASLGRLEFPDASIEAQRELLERLGTFNRTLSAQEGEARQLHAFREAISAEIFGDVT